MQSTNINIRATKKDKRLHAKASKVAGGKREAVIAGLHHVARICAKCEEPIQGDEYFTSDGYPFCTNCVETSNIRIDQE